VSATYASTYPALATTTRTGYTFNGWFTASSGGGTHILAGDAVTITAATTLYAQWLTPYEAWLVEHSQTTSDANLKEFAFGTATTGALVLNGDGTIATRGQGPIIQTAVGSALVQLTYARRKDSGCSYSAEFSNQLGAWLASSDASFIYPPAVPTEVVVDNGDGMEVVSVKFPIFRNNGGSFEKMQQNFCRISVTAP